MTSGSSIGAFFVWTWRDAEIENPGMLRGQLVAFESAGVSALLAVLGNTRYELTDRKVTRAVAQASQWARKRGLILWFQADPRKASRSLISKTGERTQNLFVLKEPGLGFSPGNLTLAALHKGRFEIRCSYRHELRIPEIHEASLAFEPSGLERAFAFRIFEDGSVMAETIRDISDEARFYADPSGKTMDIFGTVITPDEQDWRVMVFPRFDTNLADYAGRENSDALAGLIAELFDAGASLSGMTWDRGGYCREPGRFPVSLSLFNSFKAEYGYDIRDRLVALVLPMDDGSHVPVRRNYYSLLMDSEFSAFRDFKRNFHGFFGTVDTGIFHGWEGPLVPCPDPWQGLGPGESGMTVFSADAPELRDPSARIFGVLSLTRSLGAFSAPGNAFIRCRLRAEEDAVRYWSDLTCLFSVRWIAEPEAAPEPVDDGRPAGGETGEWAVLGKVNDRIRRVESLTGFRFPDADALLLYPDDSLMTVEPGSADHLTSGLLRFIGRLALHGFQVDSVSSSFLRAAKISRDGFRIGNRSYRALICPYAGTLPKDIVDLTTLLAKRGVPVFFGGDSASIQSDDKSRTATFDPESDDLSWMAGLGQAVRVPAGAVGSMVHHAGDTLLMMCPASISGRFEGEVSWGDSAFNVPESRELVIYRLTAGRPVVRVF
jgi:hypothetical protein